MRTEHLKKCFVLMRLHPDQECRLESHLKDKAIIEQQAGYCRIPALSVEIGVNLLRSVFEVPLLCSIQ